MRDRADVSMWMRCKTARNTGPCRYEARNLLRLLDLELVGNAWSNGMLKSVIQAEGIWQCVADRMCERLQTPFRVACGLCLGEQGGAGWCRVVQGGAGWPVG